MPSLVELLDKFNVVPIVDSQVGHECGKLRALPLIQKLLGGDVSCFRPRAVFAELPGISCLTPRRRSKTPYNVYVVSQKEEERHGVVQEGIRRAPSIALVDSVEFVSRGSDRRLLAWAGTGLSYDEIYRSHQVGSGAKTILEGTKNVFFQDCAASFSPKPRQGIQILDLFNPDLPGVFQFPWYTKDGWLHTWAKRFSRYGWFRSNYRRLIKHDLIHWIDDRRQLDRIFEMILTLFEGRLGTRLDRVTQWIESHEFTTRNTEP